MSDYIRKSALIEEIKKQKDDNDMHCRLCMDAMIDIVNEQPTLDETEIIRKAFERVVERLEEYAFDMSLENPDCKAVWLDRAKEIVKEECGISE